MADLADDVFVCVSVFPLSHLARTKRCRPLGPHQGPSEDRREEGGKLTLCVCHHFSGDGRRRGKGMRERARERVDSRSAEREAEAQSGRTRRTERSKRRARPAYAIIPISQSPAVKGLGAAH